MNDRQLDDIVAASNPVPVLPAAPAFSRWTEQPATARWRPSRRLVVLPALTAVAVATTAGAHLLRESGTRTPLSVACAAGLSNRTITGINARGSVPTSACGKVWAAGEMVRGRTAVPALQACVWDGRIVVYPDRAACQKLGLPAFGGYTAQQSALISTNDSVNAWAEKNRCLSASALSGFTRQELQRRGLTGWQVRQTGRGTGCAAVAFDESSRTAMVISGGSAAAPGRVGAPSTRATPGH